MNLTDWVRATNARMDALVEQREAQAATDEAIALSERLASLLDDARGQLEASSVSPESEALWRASLEPFQRGRDLLALPRAELVELVLVLATPTVHNRL